MIFTQLSRGRAGYPTWRRFVEDNSFKGAQIKRFLLLHKELDPDDDELTRTRKLRRAFVEKRYEEILTALYSDVDMVHIETTIKYEDGREAHIKTDMHIRTVEK